MEKIWHPDHPQKQLLIPVTSILFGFFLFITVFLSNGFDNTDILSIILGTILLTYGFGKLYGELTLHKNYIKVTETAIEFRETPVLGFGWIPLKRSIKFDAIKNVDLVEVRSPLFPNAHQPYLMITTKGGKSFVIGRGFSPSQLQKIAVGLSGATTLTNKLLGFINKTTGKSYTIDDIVNIGKNIISSLKDSKSMAPNGTDKSEDDTDDDFIVVD
ncbi:MAG: hypothetical protein D6732_19530 [Methanobacteriota archaeon]|nr:MAG: hypothetical protein D6732_19530 [Euryarchaeota archaeon]